MERTIDLAQQKATILKHGGRRFGCRRTASHELRGTSSPRGHVGSGMLGFRDGEDVVLNDGAPAASVASWNVPCREHPR